MMSDYAVYEVNSKRDYHAFFSFPFKRCTKIAINGFHPLPKRKKPFLILTSNPVFENAESQAVFGKKRKTSCRSYGSHDQLD